MNKAIKTIVLASFLLAMIGCSSDDSSKEPKGPEGPVYEDLYLVSSIESKHYREDEIMHEDGTVERAAIHDYTVNLNFVYDDNLNLSDATNKMTFYNDGQIVSTSQGKIEHKLNEKNQLISLLLTGGNMFNDSFVYTYQDDLLKKYNSLGEYGNYEHLFTHNAQKQFTNSSLEPQNLEFTYTYNNKNQLAGIKNTAQTKPMQIEYDNQNNPFKYLPFDLTTVLFDEIKYMPLSYIFPNNITYTKASDDFLFKIAYTYNEANFPLTAKISSEDEGKKSLEQELFYTYTVKKVEVKK
ncbi:hypothetical protein [Myroides sp. DW712]|uniref:hypothetical protein n=1 Tax=Myroides sp. DW712 TaxID=3389800 RepID=UPI00397D6643